MRQSDDDDGTPGPLPQGQPGDGEHGDDWKMLDGYKGKADLGWNTFRQRIASILRDNQWNRRVPHQRKGKLDMARLYKAMLKSDGRLFKRKQARMGSEYDVLLIVDQSGSMRHPMDCTAREPGDVMYEGDFYSRHRPIPQKHRLPMECMSRGEAAATLAGQISDLLTQLGCRVAVVGFNKYIRDIKGWDESINGWTIRNRLFVPLIRGDGAACNHDAAALRHAQELIKAAPADGKLVMLFSDGEPACGYDNCHKGEHNNPDGSDPGDSSWATREYLKLTQLCPTVSFGIGEDVSECYPNSVTVTSAQEFQVGTLRALNRVILRG